MQITDIIVQRPNAFPYKYADVYDVLIQGVECAVSRGKAVLDEFGVGHQVVSFDVPFTKNLKLGQIIEVQDIRLNITWRGKITGISHKIQIQSEASLLAMTNLKVKKPSTYFSTASDM